MSKSISAAIKYYYDDAGGTPVEITEYVLTINDIAVENLLQQTDPFGRSMEEHTPSGKGKMDPIDLGGLFETEADGPDELWRDRVPEGPDAATRTFKAELLTGRTISVETHLARYAIAPNRENGLTRYMTRLQPTGVVTEEYDT